jgi:hypothetical protein
MHIFNKTDEGLVLMDPTVPKVIAAPQSFTSYTLWDSPKRLILNMKHMKLADFGMKRTFSYALTQNKRTSIAVEYFIFWNSCLPFLIRMLATLPEVSVVFFSPSGQTLE